jgi:muramidase (phage lysozyme)
MAGAADFGGDMGLGQLAQGLGMVAAAVDVNQDRRETLEINRTLAENRLVDQESLNDDNNRAPLGDTDFAARNVEAYDARTDKTVSLLTEKGVSGKAIDRYTLSREEGKVSFSGKANSLQAANVGAKARQDVEATVDTYAKVAASDPTSYGEQIKGLRDSVDALDGTIDAKTRSDLFRYGEERIQRAAGIALATSRPDYIIEALTGNRTGGVVWDGAGQTAATFLGVIAAKESGGRYGVRYGGADGPQDISNFDDHPRQFATITSGPHKGKKSSAAGKYQFTATTWDRAAKALGLTDFSPANQDKAAWWLAQQDYAANTGRDLITDIENAEYSRIRSGLAGTWEAFAKMSDDTFAGLFASGGAALRDGKTGNPLLDAMPVEMQQAILNKALTERGRQRTERKQGFAVERENINAAYLSGQDYEGTIPDLGKYVEVYGELQGDIEYEKDETIRTVGEFRQMASGMTETEMAAYVASLKPTDTSSDVFALEQDRFQKVQATAKEIREARQADPVAYVMQAVPSVRSQVEAYQSGEATFAELKAGMDAAYDDLGISRRRYLPQTVVEDIGTRFNDESSPTTERIGAVLAPILEAGDPATQRQLFEELAAKDSSIAKLDAAVRAYADGRPNDGRALAEAVMVGSEALKVDITPSDLAGRIADLQDEGGLVDAVYGLSAGMDLPPAFNRDQELMRPAIKYEYLRNGGNLDAAVQTTIKRMYGNVQAVDSDNYAPQSGDARVLTALPAEMDADLFVEGTRQLKPYVQAAIDQMKESEIELGEGATAEMSAQATLARNAYLDDLIEAGQWRLVDGDVVFVDPASGEILQMDNRDLAFSPRFVLNAGQNFRGSSIEERRRDRSGPTGTEISGNPGRLEVFDTGDQF